MNTVDKLNNVLGWLTAMNFDKPELSNDLEEPLNVLSEVISEVENLVIHDVVKSLPNDECVEQWWSEGQDQDKDFWQKAPYRTNGDVIKEIKTALKYFIETWQR